MKLKEREKGREIENNNKRELKEGRETKRKNKRKEKELKVERAGRIKEINLYSRRRKKKELKVRKRKIAKQR